jgi:hypothetical protein
MVLLLLLEIILTEPHHLGVVLLDLLHDLALLVDPSREEQSLLLANVRVVLFIVH